ncbi:MAG: dienelactone hydrolase family protein [Acidobacteria bacterium]|nr:dienelactone hydrolase family protein [Acidobacteriota bacterium]
MDSRIGPIVSEYRTGKINRRVFFERLIAVLGTYPLAHHFLEQTGLAMTLLSPAESDQADVDSSTVKFPSDGATIEGYFSKPKGNGPFPSVILIHENRGLNDHIRDVARRLAAQGYATLVPDFLSREGGTASFATSEDATKAFSKVTDEVVIKDLDAAYKYLQSNSAVKKDDCAVWGFCWGGQRSFLYATANPKLKAAVVFYGSPPSEEKLANIKAPVLGNYGSEDARVTSTVPATTEKMKSLGKSYDAKIYDGAQHAFFNDTNKERYNEAAAKDAWARSLAFLKKHLG